MCAGRPARPALPGVDGQYATARARQVNNEGQEDHSAAGTPNGSGADSGPKHPPRPSFQRPSGAGVPPDDRLTTILPPVRDERDPIEAVQAALGGRPPTTASEGRDPLELAT